ncbi:MAG TPA: hypothetical protein VN626_10310 [Clostridia bacterium]|nr:hypothetical protein [Clostridia bacterium]
MKTMSFLLAALTAALALSACTPGKTSLPSSSSSIEPTQRSTSSQTTISPSIGFITQTYDGKNIAEIPYINDGGTASSDIEAINRSLNQGIQQVYTTFMASADAKSGDAWIEIKSYPFITPDYIQVVVSSCTYPIYGTDGDLFSINFDVKNNKWLSINDVLADLDLTTQTLTEQVRQHFVPESSSQSVGNVQATGFLIRPASSEKTVELLLEVTIENSEAEPWKFFYSYAPASGMLAQLDSTCLFDASETAPMNPPLVCQRTKSVMSSS